MAQDEALSLPHDLYQVFMIVRGSDTGLTERELGERSEALGIKEPMRLFDQLVSLGLARVQDRSGESRDNRLKATSKAFEVNPTIQISL